MTSNTYEIGSALPNEGKARRSFTLPFGEPLLESPHKTIKTLYDVLLYGSREFAANKNLLGYRKLLRLIDEQKEIKKLVAGQETTEIKTWTFQELSPYQWLSYLDVLNLTTQIGCGLVKLGLRKQDKVTVFHSTSKEWLIMAHSCFSQNMVITTAYDSLGDDALAFSLNEGEVTTLFTQTDLLKTVRKIGNKVPTLKNIIYSGEIHPDALAELEQACPQFNFFTLSAIQELGRLHPTPACPPMPHDLACIMYTSGSTGNPKGVMLTHANVVAAVAGAVDGVFYKIPIEGTYMGYLPLAHVLEFTVEHTCMFLGIPIGYGSPRSLTDASVRNCRGDIRELKPTYMSGVPAVWETIRKGVVAKLDKASVTEKFIFNKAYQLKKSLMRMGMPYNFMDTTVFKKIQEGTGGNLKLALSGGAPIAPETQEFLCITLCQVLQGYGMTESTGTLAVQPVREKSVYSIVGAPFPSVEIKLVACNAYNPNPSDGSRPQGEIWARGANIMKGYYKQPELTKETLTQDGWLMTGDVGEWREDGSLAIIDRKKNLVKLSHGEYVAIEKLESQYKTSRLIINMCIHADSLQSYIVAIVVPNEPEMAKLFKSLNVTPGEYSNQKIIDAVVKDFAACAKGAEFKGAEVLKAVAITDEEWTPENGLLTAAQKLNRKAILTKYAAQIDSLYGKNK